MAKRYMNTSEKSVVLAEGVLLYTKRMHTKVGTTEYHEVDSDWARWAVTYGQAFAQAAMKQQEALFCVAGIL